METIMNEMKDDKVMATLSRLENLLSGSKSVMNCEELSLYTGYAKSTIYKLVHRNEIPFCKPTGKKLFFDKEKIDRWLTAKSVKSKDELTELARNREFLK